MNYILLSTDKETIFRYSSVSRFFYYSLIDSKIHNVFGSRKVSFVKWSPKGDSLAFVYENNVFIRPHMKFPVQVTFDGSFSTIRNGIADWVYEEEILQTNEALYWSPDGSKLAYLKFNDSLVSSYPLTTFNAIKNEPYPSVQNLPYPKPGSPNPTVQLLIVSVDGNENSEISLPVFPDKHETIVHGVHWSFNSDYIIVKCLNRFQDHEKMVLAHFNGTSSAITSSIIREEESPWVENFSHLQFLPGGNNSYLDILPSDDYMHLAYFASIDDKEPIFLTNGSYNVVSILGFDGNSVFYLSTEIDSTERTVSKVEVTSMTKTRLTDTGYYSANISPGGGWIVLQYNGPLIPKETVQSTRNSSSFVLNDNPHLKTLVELYDLPNKTHGTLTLSDGTKINSRVTYPVGFSQEIEGYYPLLVYVYGGPNSQTVSKKWETGFLTFMASRFHNGTLSPFITQEEPSKVFNKRDAIKLSKEKFDKFVIDESQPPFVILEIDARGTGFKTNSFKYCIAKQLGKFEVDDIIQVTRDFVTQNTFIDSKKVGMWGWSYGGYLSSKVAEADYSPAGTVFNSIAAVAPVIDWRFYDTMYTERYMKSVVDNDIGYSLSAVQNVERFRNRRYLLIHGTADDNVHVQNSMQLLEKLQVSKHMLKDEFLVPPNTIRSRLIPDENHGMYKTPFARFFVYRLVADFMADSFKEVDQMRKLAGED
jgi:dipeptidyl aminopeptidase